MQLRNDNDSFEFWIKKKCFCAELVTTNLNILFHKDMCVIPHIVDLFLRNCQICFQNIYTVFLSLEENVRQESA